MMNDPKTKRIEPDEDNWAYEEDLDSEEFDYFGLEDDTVFADDDNISEELWDDLTEEDSYYIED